jgi:hypothetical protein
MGWHFLFLAYNVYFYQFLRMYTPTQVRREKKTVPMIHRLISVFSQSIYQFILQFQIKSVIYKKYKPFFTHFELRRYTMAICPVKLAKKGLSPFLLTPIPFLLLPIPFLLPPSSHPLPPSSPPLPPFSPPLPPSSHPLPPSSHPFPICFHFCIHLIRYCTTRMCKREGIGGLFFPLKQWR